MTGKDDNVTRGQEPQAVKDRDKWTKNQRVGRGERQDRGTRRNESVRGLLPFVSRSEIWTLSKDDEGNPRVLCSALDARARPWPG